MNQNSSLQKRRFVPVLLFGVVSLLFAGAIQAQDLIWAKQAGGGSADFGSNIVVDTFGNCYVTGLFEGSATFGAGEANETTLSSVGLPDIFVAKYSTDGALLWAIQVENDIEADRLPDIALDNLGNFYITSRFVGTATFDNAEANEITLTSAGAADIFVAKYNPDSMLFWARQAGGSNNDQGNGITVDGSGNSYVTGFFIGFATFGSGEANEITLNAGDNGDIFLAKYDIDGLLLWTKQAGSSEFDSGQDIAVDSAGNSYLMGSFQISATFGSGETNEITLNAGLVDMFVAKYDVNGMLIWVKQSSGNGIEFGSQITLDASSNSYVTGYFESSVTFGPGEANQITLSSAGPQDIFILKYDVDGLLLWVKRAGSSGFESGYGVVVDAFGNSHLAGHFESSATFGPNEAYQTTLESEGSFDIFVAEYDIDGLLLWAKRAGGSRFESGNGIAVDVFGNSYVTGRFQADAIFGDGEANETTLNSVGEIDIFVAKYGSEAPTNVAGVSIPADFELDQNYPNPFNPSTTIFFEAPKAVQTTLAIYNLRGQLVRTLVSGEALPGRQQVIWDGTDNNGRNVTSGVYIYKLNAGEFTATKKMILLQ